MDRRQKLLDGIDLPRSKGLEVGALCNPLVSKTESDIFYVDYADRMFLQKVYAGNPQVDPEKIVDVDFVWGQQSLGEIAGAACYDYVVASHVVEHVPDLITWVREVAAVLKPGGTLRLAVPDRRYTFDLLRRETELADVLNAYLLKARRPLPISVLDYFMNTVAVDANAAWRGQVDIAAIRARQRAQVEVAMQRAREVIEDEAYHDAHCWVFTPGSFARVFEELCETNYLAMARQSHFDTEPDQIEFFVTLGVEADCARAARSWAPMKGDDRDGARAGPADPTASKPDATPVGRWRRAWSRVASGR